ncbi:alpha/beta hydrolase [Streptomyces sp. NPDC056296]|uniref:alpha/beta hydrolase n=1 Tax=Streptomyces sp. NPDC056296 TaxID=3345775 RepID=UPI0035E0813A
MPTTPARWFADPRASDTFLGRALLRSEAEADPAGYAACCDALADFDMRGDLHRITAPTLVIGGRRDTATPLDHAHQLVDGIADATLLTVAAGHLAVERPSAAMAAMRAHLGRARHSS